MRLPILVACFLVATALPARADEGMWTFDNFPAGAVAQAYGFTVTQPWLDHVRSSSLRSGGCSASFISPDGLVMTNHHCVVGCVAQLSSAEHNFVEGGFMARTQAEERRCPAFFLDRLLEIRDVTAEVGATLAGKTGAESNAALDAERARLQHGCASDPTLHCELVTLYHGGLYDLYRYKRYTDVRLVFAPEYAVAQFGGDPDNFNFPRFDFDLGLLRVYANGAPLRGNDYLRWSARGSKPGELVFVSGNPGRTRRQMTLSELLFERDHGYPESQPIAAEYRGLLEGFSAQSAEKRREAREVLFFTENSYKGNQGREEALLDPVFFGKRVAAEVLLRASVKSRPELEAEAGTAWDDLIAVQTVRARLEPMNSIVNGPFLLRGMLGDALTLVRAPVERAKPNEDRLPEFNDQALAELPRRLGAKVPVYKDLEELRLAFGLTVMRRVLGADNAFVHLALGDESPDALAHRLVSGSHLDDANVRLALYNGGAAAVAASDDPLIRFAAKLDPALRAARKEYEARVEAPTREAETRIAHAAFAIYGTSTYPDATFTARLSYGKVDGFVDGEGANVAPYTTMGGLFARASGAPPYALPQRWLDAKGALDLATPMNFSTTNDIIGGNSGSPVVDADGRVVGLIFDGNIFSLGGDFGYDGTENRSVAVDSRALLAGLRTVYHLDRVVSEIEGAATK